MTADLIVYRSSHPAVLSAWEQAIADRQDALDAITEYGKTAVDPEHDRRSVSRPSPFGGATSEGFEHREDWPVPHGWRVRRSSREDDAPCIEPNPRTKAGKAAAARLRTLGIPDMRTALYGQGMPESELFSGYGLPGVRPMDGAIYVWWSGKIPGEPDPAKWERVKLSEYYAAVEAEDAAAAAGGIR